MICAADRRDAAGAGQGLAPHQHAAAGRRRGCGRRGVHPGERVEHRRRRTRRPGSACVSGQVSHGQLRHQGGQDQAAGLGAGDQAAQLVGRMGDVGVGQQQVVGRRSAALGAGDALALRPRACRSSRRRGARRRSPRSSPARRSRPRAASAVPSLLLSSTRITPKRARIVLGQQAADRAGDHIGLVAGRHDRHDARPGVRARPASSRSSRSARPPEAATAEQQVDPDRQRQGGHGVAELTRSLQVARLRETRPGRRRAPRDRAAHGSPARAPPWPRRRTCGARPCVRASRVRKGSLPVICATASATRARG